MNSSTQTAARADTPPRSRVAMLRIGVMVVVGIVVAVITGLAGFWALAPSTGWAAAALVYVLWVWIVIARMDGEQTASHANREDPAKTITDTVLLVASIASLAALVLMLGQAKNAHAWAKDVLAALGVANVVLSWFVVHTLYTLRYAAQYYTTHAKRKPIDFNGEEAPRYLDFAYLSFTVGMTFQVSDTDIQDGHVRATILRHMLLSYLFGAVILAGAVNLVASLAM